MKKLFLICTTVTFLLTSCNNDVDDRIEVDQQEEEQTPEEYESTDTQFTTEDEIVYFTGSLECSGSGDYFAEANNTLESLTIPNDLPETIDLSSFLPPVGNQGRQGSCVSWAATYYLKSLQERIASDLPYTNDRIMSPAYTYNQITKGICEGTTFESTLDILLEKGASSIASFPYLESSCNIQPTDAQNNEAEVNKISDYKHLSGENMVLEMKTLIQQQTPIMITAFLDLDFGKVDAMGLTAYREHSVDFSIPGGCHAMLVVGYSDVNNAFKVVNSWGTEWGDDGFVWIDYAAFENVSDQTADFRVINKALVAFDL